MFVLTVDQVGSRRGPDRVTAVLDDPVLRHGAVLGPDRTAGDEFQLLMADAAAALAAVLHLARAGGWSTGLGVGTVDRPLPAMANEASGDAYLAAREAVERAKRTPTRVAVASIADPQGAADAAALLQPVLELRARRSAAGWEVADLLASGRSQADAAALLGVTPQAISLRAGAAALRLDEAAVPALVRLLRRTDEAAVATSP